MAHAEYVFHGAGDQGARERLKLIERVFDPATQRRLLATKVQASRRGLEVGLDAGSIMIWMGEIVGLAGQMVAVVASPMICTTCPGLGNARNRLFWLDTILLS